MTHPLVQKLAAEGISVRLKALPRLATTDMRCQARWTLAW